MFLGTFFTVAVGTVLIWAALEAFAFDEELELAKDTLVITLF